MAEQTVLAETFHEKSGLCMITGAVLKNWIHIMCITNIEPMLMRLVWVRQFEFGVKRQTTALVAATLCKNCKI